MFFSPIEQWLLPHAVSDQNKTLFAGIPDGNGKHAAQVIDETQSVFFVQSHDNFRVPGGVERVTTYFEILPQFAVVVDFAVEDELNASVVIAHRLSAAVDVNDRQSTMPEGDSGGRFRSVTTEPVAFGVRPAMTNAVGHLLENSRFDGSAAVPPDSS